MDKDLFKKEFFENLDKNFDYANTYLDYDYKVFHDLMPVVFQAVKCIILELDFATITLTNHILERLLKLALINKAVGINPIEFQNLNSAFEEPNRKYADLSLGNTIELCKKENLITKEEKDILFNLVRELFRNGFSHADTTKILEQLPDEMTVFQGSLNDPNLPLEQMQLNHKLIPAFQSIHIQNFAKANSRNYFSSVFNLLKNIEHRIVALSRP